jgi:hypothetical protein
MAEMWNYVLSSQTSNNICPEEDQNGRGAAAALLVFIAGAVSYLPCPLTTYGGSDDWTQH